jgi:DNA-directed RNA polymerase subunit K/omega
MRIFTPTEVAREAGNKYVGVLVAAKFARFVNEFPKERSYEREKKLTTMSLEELANGELSYKITRRRRQQA